jgi:tetraacyldisaccharide 4'-kinase
MRNELLWGKDRPANPVTRAMSGIWGLVNGLRRKAYKKGFIASEEAGAPVISVGNLTVGGNAKTPMCIFLANQLTGRGYTPAVLSRGYGRGRSSEFRDPVLVSLGLGPLAPLEYSGDEPQLVARLTQAMVIVANKRLLAAREAVRQGADVLVLDDGYQHLGLKRNVDILMLQAENCLGNGLVLPAGPLREPVSAIKDADILVSVGQDAVPPGIARMAGERPAFAAVTRPTAISTLNGDCRMDLKFLQGRRFAAFCGLARPLNFKNAIGSLGLEPVAFRAYPDHEPYGPIETRELKELLNFSRSEYLLTTLKDAVKLRDLELPILVLESELAPVDPAGLVREVLNRISPPAAGTSVPAER